METLLSITLIQGQWTGIASIDMNDEPEKGAPGIGNDFMQLTETILEALQNPDVYDIDFSHANTIRNLHPDLSDMFPKFKNAKIVIREPLENIIENIIIVNGMRKRVGMWRR